MEMILFPSRLSSPFDLDINVDRDIKEKLFIEIEKMAIVGLAFVPFLSGPDTVEIERKYKYTEIHNKTQLYL